MVSATSPATIARYRRGRGALPAEVAAARHCSSAISSTGSRTSSGRVCWQTWRVRLTSECPRLSAAICMPAPQASAALADPRFGPGNGRAGRAPPAPALQAGATTA